MKQVEIFRSFCTYSSPPLYGGAITQIEPGISSSDGYFKPRFALDGDYDSLRAYKRAMLQKYGSEKWQELQEKAEAMQKRLTGIDGTGPKVDAMPTATSPRHRGVAWIFLNNIEFMHVKHVCDE